MQTFLGINIHTAPFPLERQMPVKKHKKTRHQSESYHRRVQKKWTKQYGTKTERYAIMVNGSPFDLLGAMRGPTMFIDPRDLVLLEGLA